MEHEDQHHSRAFRQVAEQSAPMTMVSQEASADWTLSFQEGVSKVGYNAWWVSGAGGCGAPRAMTKKNMGHFLPLTRGVFSLSLSFSLAPSPSLYLQLSSQERSLLFRGVCAYTAILLITKMDKVHLCRFKSPNAISQFCE